MDVIATHSNADFDALASMVAAKRIYPEAKLVLPAGAQETVRSFLCEHDLGLTRLNELDPSLVTRLILVNTQDPERIGALKACVDKPSVEVVVFDHHVDESSVCVGRSADSVVEAAGATATILIELLRRRHITPTPFEATVLALGLYAQTGSFLLSSTTSRDLVAAAFLVESGADVNLVADTLRRPLDPEAVALLNDLLEHSDVHYLGGRKILVATSTLHPRRGEAAQVVHRLAELQGVDAVLAAVTVEDRVQIIGQSRRPDIDVGWIAREFGGDGHAVAAAASVKGELLAGVKDQLVHLLRTQYRPTLLAQDVMTRPVKTIGLQTTIAEAGQRMTNYGVNVFPILDQKERYAGLVSRELIQKALFHRLGRRPVREIMQADTYQAAPDTSFHTLETMMIEGNQRFVPVVKGAKVIGVITRTDVLRILHDDVLKLARVCSREPGHSDAAHGGHRNIKELLRERLSRQLTSLLEEAGRLADRLEVSLFAVGGCVRDWLLGIENFDLDFVVEGDGIGFARKLAEMAKARVTIHERFGTAVVLLPDGQKLDVATARTEYYDYPAALPTVEQSSITKDLYRRDFTVNALAIRLNGKGFGELLDYYGGQRDLNEKVLRVLHGLSFVEDPTRVFRAIRFEVRFGFHLGRDTVSQIKVAVQMNLFRRLSGHRLLTELKLLFRERETKQAIRRLAELDLLRCIHLKLQWSDRLHCLLTATEEAVDRYRLLVLDRTIEVWLVYMIALMDALPPRAFSEVVKRFPFSESEAATLKASRAAGHTAMHQLVKRPPLKPAQVYRLLSGLPDETLVSLMAKSKDDVAKRQISAYFTTYRSVKPLLNGTHLRGMGIKAGPEFKRILDRLHEARLNGEVNTESEERALANRLAKQTPV